jgi:glycosyltransferase involved in cell wall biosynthesis
MNMEKRTRMEIVMVGDYPLEKEKVDGGVQWVMVNLVDSLAQTCDIVIHVIAPKKEIESDSSFTDGNIHYHFIPKCTPYELAFILNINERRILKKLSEIKPAIVHIQNYEYSYLCKRSPCPTILTPHGMPRLEARYRYGTLAKFRTWLHGALSDWFTLRYTKYLILISEYSRGMVKISPQTKLFFIPVPIKSDFFHLKNRELRDRLLFVAADITPRKNPMLLLKALAALRRDFPSISVHLVGYFSNNDFFNSLQRFIRENGIEKNVQFMGPLPVKRVVEEYEECSVYVLTSEWENLPAVVGQAMAPGKAIIATRVGGVEEMIQDGTTGLSIAPGDLNALIHGIEILLKDDALRQRMGKAAREEALKKFSGEVVARKTLEAYRTILNQ